MDLRAAVIVSAVVLVAAGLDQPSSSQTGGQNVTELTTTSTSSCSCTAAPTEASVVPTSSAPSLTPTLGLLTVNWTGKCEGIVYLIPYLSFNESSLPVCHSQDANIKIILENVCKNRKCCKNVKSWSGPGNVEGYNITDGGASMTSSCKPLKVSGTAEDCPDVDGLQRQLQSYKVVTALLCCVLLVLLLIRFTRPTVTALQSRLSDKRRERWIGPTQSHSVSYHRGKAAVRGDDGEKRLSYPALERLTVRHGSDLSCNRNSGYDF